LGLICSVNGIILKQDQAKHHLTYHILCVCYN
jgi:hypothetical protein